VRGEGESEVADARFSAGRHQVLVDFDPATFMPVTAALMFTPAVSLVLVLSPSPIVGVNGDPELGAEMMDLSDMPAIALTIAYDFGGCGGWLQSQCAHRAQDCSQDPSHT
jgi:hypothetical protein